MSVSLHKDFVTRKVMRNGRLVTVIEDQTLLTLYSERQESCELCIPVRFQRFPQVAQYYGRTKGGNMARMCPDCFAQRGTGSGSRYVFLPR